MNWFIGTIISCSANKQLNNIHFRNKGLLGSYCLPYPRVHTLHCLSLSPYPCVCVQQEHWFEKALREKKGFVIKKMKEDGACLFRAVGEWHTHTHTPLNTETNRCVSAVPMLTGRCQYCSVLLFSVVFVGNKEPHTEWSVLTLFLS